LRAHVLVLSSRRYIANNLGYNLRFDCTPATEELGVRFEDHPMTASLPEMAQWLLEIGAAPRLEPPPA